MPDTLADVVDAPVWTGRWVQEALGVRLHDTAPPALTSLVGLAVRRNPRRAHLLVSTVLGKHVPTDPAVVAGAGHRLGRLVREQLRVGAPPAGPDRGDAEPVVLGFAETATALGHLVADVLEAPYLHSTRRRVDGVTALGGFEESHSHAADHLLLPTDPRVLGALARDTPLVLVDDEVSTGATALHTIDELHRLHPRSHYVLATLVDLRSPGDRERMAEAARAHGTRIDVVALATGAVDLPPDVLARGQQLVASVEASRAEVSDDTSSHEPCVVRVEPAAATWGTHVKEGGRHGFLPADRPALETAVHALAVDVAAACGPARRVHVLGFEELMYAPLRLAMALGAGLLPGADVTFSTTTSSPVLVVDDPGYPVRSALVFPAHDDPVEGSAPRRAHNVAAPASDPGARFDVVVVVVDRSGDRPPLTAPGGLVPQLARAADRVVLVVLPEHRPSGVDG